MNGFVQMTADVLVAVLLVATIAVSLRLSRNLSRLRSDETAMRATIGELVSATDKAERAVTALRSTLDECDFTLADRLRAAERCAAELARGTAAGETVMNRIDAILDKTRRAAQLHPAGRAPPPPRRSGSETLEVAVATAQAVADRAARRIVERAA